MRKFGFTLAEALLTIVIIGVVAALIIPPVVANYEDKKYNTARLKALHTFGEAGKMAAINDLMTGQENAKDFVNNVLSKYLKITKVCDTAEECNFPSKILPFSSSTKLVSDDITKLNSNVYIATADGFTAKLFYNPTCLKNTTSASLQVASPACINIIYDMNGPKEPNRTGNDIGIVTTFWSGYKTTSVAPGLSSNKSSAKYADAIEFCASQSTSKIQYYLPTLEEVSSLFINRDLTSITGVDFWSSTIVEDRPDLAWIIYGNFNTLNQVSQNNGGTAWCVRR